MLHWEIMPPVNIFDFDIKYVVRKLTHQYVVIYVSDTFSYWTYGTEIIAFIVIDFTWFLWCFSNFHLKLIIQIIGKVDIRFVFDTVLPLFLDTFFNYFANKTSL